MRRSSRSYREEKRSGHRELSSRHARLAEGDIAIEATGLTQRFGDFVAVDHVSFRISRGEIFGFLGSNGCGKTTTMKMLTGLLPPTEGTSTLFGEKMDANDIELRRRVGFMSQAFSLYSELTVQQNLDLHARLFRLPPEKIPHRIAEVAERFELKQVMDALPDGLPMGIRQRLSLAVAMIHSPEMLILDEPTSGVDPVARDGFWQILVDLSRKDNVTIFISTHFMNEAARCDRISLMNAGKVLVSDTPKNIVAMRARRRSKTPSSASWRTPPAKSLGRERRLNRPRPQPLRRRNGDLCPKADFSARGEWPPTWCARRSNSAAITCA